MEKITDLTPYRKYLDAFDLTEEDKLELVNTLQLIIQKVLDEELGITSEKTSQDD